MLPIFSRRIFLALGLSVITTSTVAEEYQFMADWQTMVDGPKMMSDHIEGLDASTAPFQLLYVQTRFFDQGTLSDGVTEIDTTRMEISLVARMKDGGAQLADEIRPYMPRPGCNDSNNISADYEHNFSGDLDLRSNQNRTITYQAIASGTERACDWPKPTYGTWRKNFSLQYSIALANEFLSFTPNVDAGATSINTRTAGRIGREALRILDQLASIGNGSVLVPNPERDAARMDVSIASRISRLNEVLSGQGLTLPEEGFFAEGGEFFDISTKFSWSDTSRFYRDHITTDSCGRVSEASQYFVRFDYTTPEPISAKLANNLSKNLIEYLSAYEIGNGHVPGLALAADGNRSETYCRPPQAGSGCFRTSNGYECRIEP